MKIRIGDNVVIISGKDKGRTGSILRVLPNKGRVVVSGINMRTKHVRATPQRAGERVQYEASIHVSNVMLVDPKTKKRTRIGYSLGEKGKKRVARQSGELLPEKKAGAKVADAKTAKGASAKAEKTEKETKNTKKTTAKTEEVAAAKPEAKKPFWKRAMNLGSDAVDQAESEKSSESTPTQDTSSQRRDTARGK